MSLWTHLSVVYNHNSIQLFCIIYYLVSYLFMTHWICSRVQKLSNLIAGEAVASVQSRKNVISVIPAKPKRCAFKRPVVSSSSFFSPLWTRTIIINWGWGLPVEEESQEIELKRKNTDNILYHWLFQKLDFKWAGQFTEPHKTLQHVRIADSLVITVVGCLWHCLFEVALKNLGSSP